MTRATFTALRSCIFSSLLASAMDGLAGAPAQSPRRSLKPPPGNLSAAAPAKAVPEKTQDRNDGVAREVGKTINQQKNIRNYLDH